MRSVAVKLETGNVIKVLFFASLRERLNCESVSLEYQPKMTLSDVKNHLMNKSSLWKEALGGNVLAAVNQEMASDDSEVMDNSEVAFFPPVTGG